VQVGVAVLLQLRQDGAEESSNLGLADGRQPGGKGRVIAMTRCWGFVNCFHFHTDKHI
jgi:hypothetical protein